MHGFIQNFCTRGGGHRNWWLFSSIDPYVVVSKTIATHHQTVPVMGSYDSILCGDSLAMESFLVNPLVVHMK